MWWRSVPSILACLACLATGCGDGLVGVDALGAEPDDRGLVRFTLRDDVVARRAVYFQDVDGTLVLATRTDAAGQANAFMRPGGTVTVVFDRGNTRWLYTYVAVQPDDDLVLDTRFNFPAPPIFFQLRLPSHPGASFYQAYAACDRRVVVEDVTVATIEPIVIRLDECAPPVALTIVAFGGDGSRAYLHRLDAVRTGDVVFNEPYRPIERSAVALSRVPSTVDELFVSQQLDGLPLFDAFASVPIVGGEATAMFDVALAPEGTLITHADPINTLEPGEQRLTSWAPTTSTTAIDLHGGLRAYTARPTWNSARQAVMWTETEAGDRADTVLAGIAYFRPSAQINFQWMIIAPRGAEPTVAFPRLPDPDLNPRSDEVPTPFTLVNATIDGGYDRLRPRLLGRWTTGVAWPIDGPSGTVRYQQINPRVP